MLSRGAVWVAIYLAFILAPLFALTLGSLRRLFADRLVMLTAAAVILMAIPFAYERVAG